MCDSRRPQDGAGSVPNFYDFAERVIADAMRIERLRIRGVVRGMPGLTPRDKERILEAIDAPTAEASSDVGRSSPALNTASGGASTAAAGRWGSEA